MEKESKIIQLNSFVRGYHAYMSEIWEPDVNDENPLKLEPNNIADNLVPRVSHLTAPGAVR